ncbi:hypothetical protein [Roseisolibacter agri]|uniref:Uncharacterized protein n=1 Tax=Roseisolibacter agri TaxID=2014610 RepID=A0AA37Q495_9BACT|nr:hypothetical protein [Roseisolibacter agri]GLC23492.1 hypothetical protein rosag_00050 [Roseisolibacter agri]
MPLLPSNLPPAPPLARLLSELPTPATRVVCTGGVTLRRGPAGAPPGAWGVAADAPTPAVGGAGVAGSGPMLAATLRALGLRPADVAAGLSAAPPWGAVPGVEGTPNGHAATLWTWQAVDPDALARDEGVRPVVLVTDECDPPGDGGAHLVSAAGTLAWRPPLETLADVPSLGAHALRLRFLVDAAEQRALAAALRYARAAEAARQTATLLDARELTTLAVSPALFVEVDALFGAASETLDAVARLLEDAFGAGRWTRGARGRREPVARGRRAPFDARLLRVRAAPPELRDALLSVWDAHGSAAAGHRRAVRRAAAAELGPPTVRVQRLGDGGWSVRLPITAEPAGLETTGPLARRGRQDAFGLAWTYVTEAWRAATLAIYAATAE